MEQLGGGGNTTMAAAQLPGASIYKTVRKLERVIRAYAENRREETGEDKASN